MGKMFKRKSVLYTWCLSYGLLLLMMVVMCIMLGRNARNQLISEYKSITQTLQKQSNNAIVPFPVSWTVKMKKKQKETQDILSYHTQAAGCSDKARAKASGGRQPIEECGRTGL